MNALVRPVRIQLSRRKGWRMPPNTVKVCRPTRWGNPHRIGACDGCLAIHSRAEAVQAFERGLTEADRAEAVRDLAGKNLACWCPLPEPGDPDICHAAVLLELVNKE